ncbi:hypothetical protein [Neptunicella marina]|uniref:Uncharacterized protein n=1 Tax=Neptunicella marina TaxID=2125989 RepID=A0A8J6M0E7_9ALTE|nr:hypothetical protein [Neptunicella marina]MBC3767094.1 hypothetical protein [Neptunicella marina]
MQSVVTVLVDYLAQALPLIKQEYNWRIPVVAGFGKSGEKGYSANIALKHFLHQQWLEADIAGKQKLAKVIVADWGGVKGNKTETLHQYVERLSVLNPPTPLKGIASYSKIFAVADLYRFAIYDARVAVSLNALQWLHDPHRGFAFSYISGRNNVTGHATKRIGFVYTDTFKINNLVKAGWQRIARDDTYRSYMQLLNDCLQYFPDYKLYDLEMALFANAERLALEAMKRAGSISTT